jgi:lysozyme
MPFRLARRARAVLCCLLAAIAAIAGSTPAFAARNGQLPSSQLATIVKAGSCTKLRVDAAAAYNTLQLRAGRRLSVNGCSSAYRKVGRTSDFRRGVFGTQWFFRGQWCSVGKCVNAAVPGTSNHGLGIAVDVPPHVRAIVDRLGRRYGWCKCWSDAPHESWHLRWRAGVWRQRPDPGPSLTEPLLAEGSGGPGQGRWVRILQRRLSAHGLLGFVIDGHFGPATRKAVIGFQAARRLPGDGRVGPRTWRALRRQPKLTPAPAPAPKPVGPVSGVDVSQWQGDVDWAGVRRGGHEFAVVKTSEGATWRDPAFSTRRMLAVRRAGLVRGVYHFLRPQPGRSGVTEASFAVQVARTGGWGPGDLPLVADIESTKLPPAGTCHYLRTFTRRVRELTGRAPIIYTFPSFAASTLRCGEWLAHHELWIAHYGVNAPTIPGPWQDATIWQHTDHGHADGIAGTVDLNRLAGGRPRLSRLLLPDAPPAPATR